MRVPGGLPDPPERQLDRQSRAVARRAPGEALRSQPMFATLAGDLPHPRTLRPSWRRHALVVQVEAGLGIPSDGLVHDEDGAALVAEWRRTRALADELGVELPLKLAVTGPWARAARGQAGIRTADAVAARLRAALGDLAGAGCRVIEIHEPAPTLPTEEAGAAAFVRAHVALLDGLPADLHATLAVTGGDTGRLSAGALATPPYRSYLLDLLEGHESWRVIVNLPGDRGVIVGVGDASGRDRTGLEAIAWAAQYAASTRGRGLDRVGLAPSAGLGGLSPGKAREILDLLGETSRLLAGDPEALLRRMDPRAVDLRSAALGAYAPDPTSRRPG